MAKTKRKKGRSNSRQKQSRSIDWGTRVSARQRRRDRLILAGIAAVAVVVGGGYWWQNARSVRDFEALAAAGTDALAQVESEAIAGNRHLAIGERYGYPSRFPTSGPHDQRPLPAGFYDTPQRPERLVHSQEHGHIVIYYDGLDPADRETLKSWTSLYIGRWDGVIATPQSGLGRGVVLVAWGRRLRLPSFDANAAAAFIDAYRGRGPEQRVR